ncbi:hypothetical protein A2419_01240 [Candidatus Adlerbacteria bacterium RIFOXYC1_FULL_48_26]|uniref:Uncharacterized protein n=1 Tax=Candidatus Adlerbacteria bacterium RIFOXYC1_FULL_48_26 TaxID=1797247 RepID=A0A1F4Y2K0_9BACT|nr:MAG: hypothetical protein A2419_01240 [Candidatus Adlerbacteria bacterium RIFOXYC1_FULL_48_26]OGC93987.1 MAG: hypothetical protein A2389_00695 [Candidatus Adlerbacteria bacterium RIFOXYB1_FULL_48_10]OGC95342.1 MAG: hypothetical protein A2590_02460 [Candidatus Adlerbacteria bacterium RIFOXYD1_FULL_48_8]
MNLKSKRVVTTSLSLFAAALMIGSSLVLKDTQYENAWLYIFIVWAIVTAVIEISCFRKK